ncbi:MAG: type II toxin-antitoxin system VapC family toxin [Desulfonatronovibrio sp.]
MNFLVDTCVISELVKKEPDLNVVSWIRSCPEEKLFLSSLTIGELQKGVSKLEPSKKKNELQYWINIKLLNRFTGRIIPIDSAVAQRWGQIQAKAEQMGNPMPALDGLIAATALIHNLTVLTRNVKDMKTSGAEIVNPWGL